MAYIYATINKSTLAAICTRKKVSVDYLSINSKYSIDRINRWLDESDSLLPTINQAKKLAAILHVPFASLYMESKHIPFQTLPRIKNMRTIADSSPIDISALNIAIVDLLTQRDFLISINRDLQIPTPSFSFSSPSGNDPEHWANSIRSYLNVDLGTQYRSESSRKFYLYLRERIESIGIFVHGFTGIPVESVRGLAIYDTAIPIIGINADDRPPAKSFTIIHELVHILKRQSTYCNDMYNSFSAKREESFCNAVSGEFLVPENALLLSIKNSGYKKPYSLDAIRELATRFSVSREVIVRRLLDLNEIDKNEYDTYNYQFQLEITHEREKLRIAQKEGHKRPLRNVSRETIDRTSSSICRALYVGYNEDYLSKKSISYHLGVSQKHIDKILLEVSKWNN